VAETIRTSRNLVDDLEAMKMNVIDLTDITLATGLGYSLGSFMALLTGIAICMKRKWFWVNSFLAFIFLLLLNLLLSTGWEYVNHFFLLPGNLFNGATYYLINGSVLLLLGTIALLWNKGIEKPKSNATA
jgi:hypothetical protein